MPFRVTFDQERGQLVLMMTFGVQPRQRVTSELIPSAEAAAVQIALNRHEARMRAHLADAIAECAEGDGVRDPLLDLRGLGAPGDQHDLVFPGPVRRRKH